jgi:hypothetical protein
MLQLTDDQQHIIERLAAPLSLPDRERYRRRVFQLLANYNELGDGLVNRVAAAAQRETLVTPPSDVDVRYGSKWSRHAGAK